MKDDEPNEKQRPYRRRGVYPISQDGRVKTPYANRPKGCCAGYRTTYNFDCNDFVILLAVLTLLMVGVTMIVRTINASDDAATTLFHIEAKGDDVIPGPGDPDGKLFGWLRLNRNLKTIEWDFLYDKLDPLISLQIRGPLNATSVERGALAVALCGFPSPSPCPPTIPLVGIVEQLHTGSGLREVITDIQKEASFYYLEGATTAFPDGAFRVSLGPAF